MVIKKFPPIELSDENGLIAVGGDLDAESLLLAYSSGIFPWPYSNETPLTWFSPDPRGVIFYKDLNINQSFQKILNKNLFEIKFNTLFEQVIINCANSNKRKDKGTWITLPMIDAYINLHRKGHAFSCEAYDKNQNLVGGIYGVQIGHYFSGESMFFTQSNASKVALVALMQRLHELGVEWLDTQMVTEAVKKLGGKELSREEFLNLLKENISKPKIVL